jgi:hypothetical protein
MLTNFNSDSLRKNVDRYCRSYLQFAMIFGLDFTGTKLFVVFQFYDLFLFSLFQQVLAEDGDNRLLSKQGIKVFHPIGCS